MHSPDHRVSTNITFRQNYRDLCLIYGREAARELLNEIADTTEERMK